MIIDDYRWLSSKIIPWTMIIDDYSHYMYLYVMKSPFWHDFYVDSIVVNEQFAMPVRTTSHIVLLM